MHAFLVVIYKRKISEVPTLIKLRALEHVSGMPASLVVWDNSPKLFEQEALGALEPYRAPFDAIRYVRAPDNPSLSSVYNKVLSDSFDAGSDFVTILDHDSELAPDFLRKIHAVSAGAGLIVPKVKSNRTAAIISPRFQRALNWTLRPDLPRNISPEAIGTHSARDLFAVGSGLTLARATWESGLRFDERLAFYGVDTEFCRDYSALFPQFAIADTFVVHDISSENEEPIDILRWRFNVHMDYWSLQLAKHSALPAPLARLYVGCWRHAKLVHLALRALWRGRRTP